MLSNVIDVINASRRPMVCGHVNPDSDCIGSQLVLLSALRGMGKEPILMLPSKTVARKSSALLKMIDGEYKDPSDLVGVDLIIVVDTALPKRINLPKDMTLPKVPICNIDHHVGNTNFGDVNWVESTAGSCSQLIYKLMCEMDVKLSDAQATLLYSGVHGDTRGFSLATVNELTLDIAARLAGRGAKIGEICQSLHRSQDLSEFKLIQTVYANTKISDCGRIAWSSVSQDEFNATGSHPNDIDEQVNIPRSIEGVKIAFLLSESKRGVVRINFRAEDDITILPLAKHFGGGGHSQAAGATCNGSIEEVAEKVIKAAVLNLDQPELLASAE